MISLTDSQKIGMGLTGFGLFFLVFGMMLFFDKALLAIGNRHKAKATGFFLGEVLAVLIGWPVVGVLLEIYGFFLLFRGFFPVAVGFIRRIPVLGSLLGLPAIGTASIAVAGARLALI
ncbi:vesicle transport protein GOT1B-like isoform X5 [Syngnathoides biaculeatus]|uniref:vesicle transport protein GOT1B-like isoform X5 n=1 Tax=Syngnathoides biaculeatus TaxID=300417 RepID=UPI002ADE212B|nr:vesicle transport protein GOT1B-like isoform X5 [Syngnathoides biaculeatus]